MFADRQTVLGCPDKVFKTIVCFDCFYIEEKMVVGERSWKWNEGYNFDWCMVFKIQIQVQYLPTVHPDPY